MKYTITINQAGVVEFGLADKTDFTDWAILDAVRDLEVTAKVKKINGMVLINYGDFIKSSIPSCGLKSKSALSKRLHNLKKLELVDFTQESDNSMHIKTTALSRKVISFKVDV